MNDNNNNCESNEAFVIDQIADEVGGYFALPTEESLIYTKLLFDISDKYGIDYYHATPKEKYFVEEVTRVTWAFEHGEETTPAFVA